jgi:Uma2 family endonuclease
MTTKTKPVTADDLLMMPEDENRYELLRGVLIKKMPPGDRHGDAVIWTSVELGTYVRANNYGAVRAEIGYRLESDPDTVRAPDVSWIAPEHVYEPIPGYPNLTPDLAIEVKSPGNSNPEMAAKAQMWLSYGSKIVLVLDPVPVTVTIYRPHAEPVVLGENDELDLDDLMPGFSCPVWRLFRQQPPSA